MTCLECLHARQLVVYEKYEDDCIGCGIRKLAYMRREERQVKLQELEFACGRDARDEAVRMLREEMARIKALSEARPKERT
jgi:hypothetical protein